MNSERIENNVQTHINGVNKPFMTRDLWPLRITVWENATGNGGTWYQLQLEVFRMEQNGNKRVDKLKFPLREAPLVAKLLEQVFDKSLARIAGERL